MALKVIQVRAEAGGEDQRGPRVSKPTARSLTPRMKRMKNAGWPGREEQMQSRPDVPRNS